MGLGSVGRLTRWFYQVLPCRAPWPPRVVYQPWSDLLYGVQLGVLRSGLDNVLVRRESVSEWLPAEFQERLAAQVEPAFEHALQQMRAGVQEFLSTEGRTVCRAEGNGIQVTVVCRHRRSATVP